MHLEPEKYQYFFEKYIRQVLKPEDKEAFEKRLMEDPEFALEFERYKNNRDIILKRELDEYEQPIISTEAPKNWGWVYLIISILGFVLVLDYYINTNYDNALAEKRKSFLNKINIFKSEPEPEQSLTPSNQKENTEKSIKEIHSLPEDSLFLDSNELYARAEQELDEQLNSGTQSEPDQMPIQQEQMLADSLFQTYSLQTWDAKLKALSIETDSVLGDSAIFVLTQKSILRKTAAKAKPLFVEYWLSPVNFMGYRYNGRKLIIYGLEPDDFIMFLYSDLSSSHSMVYKQIIIPLISDSQFHKLNFK